MPHRITGPQEDRFDADDITAALRQVQEEEDGIGGLGDAHFNTEPDPPSFTLDAFQEELTPGTPLPQGPESAEATPAPAVTPEEGIPADQEPSPEPPVDDRTVIEYEDLDKYRFKTKVYGEEKVRDLADAAKAEQTLEAALKQLEDAKALKAEWQRIHEAGIQAPAATPAAEEQPDMEYWTDEQKKIYELEGRLNQQDAYNQEAYADSLINQEDVYVTERMTSLGISTDELSARLHKAIEVRPEIGAFAQKIFGTKPTSTQDLAERKAMFESLLAITQVQAVPQAVADATATATEQGRADERREAKRSLMTVETGTVQQPDPAVGHKRKLDYIRDAGEQGAYAAANVLEDLLFDDI